ncbi:MAG: fibronectin type III domain-containing protein [Chthoniobacteraceae bacterium]
MTRNPLRIAVHAKPGPAFWPVLIAACLFLLGALAARATQQQVSIPINGQVIANGTTASGSSTGTFDGGAEKATAEFSLQIDASGEASFLVDNVALTTLTGSDSSQLIVTTGTVTATAVFAPIVTTGTATSITGTSSILNGIVNPNGDHASVTFEYGPTNAYGFTTAAQLVPLGISGTGVAANVSGLISGSTYHFRVDATNTVTTTTGSDVVFTLLPASPPPTALTGTAANVTGTSATLNATVDPNGFATSAMFQYGLTGTYGSVTASQNVGSGTSAQPVVANLSGLAPSTTYHFQVTGSNVNGVSPGGDMTFTTGALVLAPTVATGSATLVTATSATLNGMVNPNNGDTTVAFEYGLSGTYGQTSASVDIGTGTNSVPVSKHLFGLTPNKLYHFQVTGSNSAGISPGGDMTFMTAVLTGTSSPTVMTGSATELTSTTATLNGMVNPNGADTSVTFQYGLTGTYGMVTASQDIGSGTTSSPVAAGIIDLTADTTYHFQVTGSNVNGIVSGSDQTFTTLMGNPLPTVTTNAASPIGATVAILNGSVNPNGFTTSAYFEYGLDTNYGSITGTNTSFSGASSENFFANISQLLENTTYYFRAVGVSDSGTGYGIGSSFTTLLFTSDFAGKYLAAISGTSNATSGLVTVAISTKNSFSASVELAGATTRLTGTFDSSGAGMAVKSGYTLQLQLVDTDTGRTITGTLTGPVQFDFDANELVTSATATAYTLRLPPPASPDQPQGVGYGKMTISKSGAISATGKLGDGTTFTAGGGLASNGTWALYVPLYSKGGCIVGTITLENTVNGNLDGPVSWFKPTTKGNYDPDPFATEVNLYGSLYIKPAKNQMVITATNGVIEFELNDGNLASAPINIEGFLGTNNKVTFLGSPAPDNMTITITTANGLFSGTFKDPTPGAKNATRSFHGAVFQDGLNFGAGEFTGTSEAGSIQFAPP